MGGQHLGMEIRSCHPHAFKSAEWGRIVADDEANGRAAWLITWPDGATDVWVVEDPAADYEFRQPA